MANLMVQWQYYLAGDHPEEADSGRSGIVRLPLGAPVSLAELVLRKGAWVVTDIMWRAKYLGSDYEFTEISEERARQLLARWVEMGRIAKLPDEESALTAAEAEQLAAMDRQADAVWSDVPTPPGAEDIR